MTQTITLLITGIAALVIGFFVGRMLLKRMFDKQGIDAQSKANLILKEAEVKAETVKKDKILEAKERFIKLKSEFEDEAIKRKNQIVNNEQKIKQQQQSLDSQITNNKRKESELDSNKETLQAQLGIVKKKQEDLDKVTAQQVGLLEKVANLTADEARDQLKDTLMEEVTEFYQLQLKSQPQAMGYLQQRNLYLLMLFHLLL